MVKNNLNQYLEKKYGKDVSKIISNYNSQKQKYVQQVK
jgi:hypothetical protein